MNSLEFSDTSYEQLQMFIATGKSKDMPDALVTYLQALETCRSMYDKYQEKKFIVKTLTLPPWKLTEYHANRIFTDAINFFYSNNEVKREAWAHIYADKLDKLAKLAIQDNDWPTANKCFQDAAKLRMGEVVTQTIPKQLLERRPIFYTIKPKDIGLPEANRNKLAQWIDSLDDIPAESRIKLHRDAMTAKTEGNVFEAETVDIPFTDATE
jgi:hypothetical protein